ncbi:MAG TPA: hypothetical protein VNN07_10310 [Candidatus Tectomicrobia bacterium]|nr:hypothetical protein [Candidatus Tectomicrobia bacterium]
MRLICAVVTATVVLILGTIPAGAQAPAPTTPAPGAPSRPAPGTPGTDTVQPPLEAPEERPLGPIPAQPGVSGPVPGAPGPAIVPRPPLIGPDLFNVPAPIGPVTLTPSFTLSGEYNDNIFLTEDGDSDFILGFTPGITLSIRRPTFSLTGGYNLTAEVYADHDELSDINAHRLFINGSYAFSPRLRASFSESFLYSRDTNVVSAEAIASGRRDSFTNTIGAGIEYDVTRLTTVRAAGSYSLQTFEGGGAGGADSDTFRLGAAVDHRFTPRFTGIAGYDFGYISTEGEDDALTHTLSLGGRYAFTPTLTGYLAGGPTFVDQSGDLHVAPAITAGLRQLLPFGSATIGYSRSVGTGGGFGGVTENQAVAANLSVTTWLRGLTLGVTPRYATSESIDGDGEDLDLKTFTLGLNATYQLTRVVSLIASYTFYMQRSDGAVGLDVDQNRLFFGIQIAYPIALQ